VQDGPEYTANPLDIWGYTVTPPLAPGVYTFTLTWVPDIRYTGPPLVPQVFTVPVLISDPSAVPTLSHVSLAVIALLMSLSGFIVLSRTLTANTAFKGMRRGRASTLLRLWRRTP